MAGVVHIPWYATGFRADGFEQALNGIAAAALRYGATSSGPPSIASTVKINRAGFTDMMDTEDMWRKWFRQAKQQKLLP